MMTTFDHCGHDVKILQIEGCEHVEIDGLTVLDGPTIIGIDEPDSLYPDLYYPGFNRRLTKSDLLANFAAEVIDQEQDPYPYSTEYDD